jgi:phage terminase large subunit
LIYERKLTNAQLMERMDTEVADGHAPIYADCAEPQRIEEIRQFKRKNGGQFNVHPSDKAVKNGIDSVKRCKLHITERSVNLLKEIRSYKWREDKNGNVLDEPVKFLDHAVDAVRYGIHSHSRPLPVVEIY